MRDGRREGGGRVNIWGGGGGGGGVNFDRRMEASVGKSPEGEQLLMPSNRSLIQDFISVVASCFLFLLPILLSCSLLSSPLPLLFTHHLISSFLTRLSFYLLCSSPFIPLFFPLQLSPNSLSLFFFACSTSPLCYPFSPVLSS